MHPSPYVNQIEKNIRFRDLYEQDYLKRLQFARDNGCNTVILTGDGEPLMNRTFLTDFSHWNKELRNSFNWIEIQTSGVLLNDEYLRYLRNTVKVNTIALSLSNMFDSKINKEINRTPDKLAVNIEQVCSEIKRYDFNLRLCLNMSSTYNDIENYDKLFVELSRLGVDQVLFRKLYVSGTASSEQDKWINDNNYLKYDELLNYIETQGRPLEVLPFGATRYSVNGISTVLDTDCMNTQIKETVKYLVLRPNCKLYTKWDDTGSLLF
jgi:sulfatase maturation enzyme AslB (radical SAM superfamily)